MHADFTHLLFNMFALWMFGKTLENMWGGKRFLIYYMITGFGAALIYVGYIQFQIYTISSNIDSETYNIMINKGNNLLIVTKSFDSTFTSSFVFTFTSISESVSCVMSSMFPVQVAS